MNLPKRVATLAAFAALAFHNLPTFAVPQLQQDEIIYEDSDTLTVAATDLLPEIEEPANRVPTDLVRERLGLLQGKIPLVYHAESHKFVEYFIYTKPDFTRRMMEDKNLFFPIYEKTLAKYNMPDELKYLSMIESGLNPRIISYAGAGGLWQFMRATGREFGLKQDSYIDERFDPVKSTDAACRYLKQLYNIFGDWEMALASYNCGPGNVKRAMRRTGGNTFWGIYNGLPKQTRGYVPQFVAILYMMHYGEDHGIVPNVTQFPTVTDTIQVNGYLNLATFAALSGVTMEEIQRLNPQIISFELPEYTRNFGLKVPSRKYAYMQSDRLAILDSASKRGLPGVLIASSKDGEFSTKRMRHTVRSGETLTSVARRYGVSISEIKSWNKMRSNRLLRGQRLTIIRKVRIVPNPATKAAAVVLAKNTTKETPDTTEADDEKELVADASEVEEEPESRPVKATKQSSARTATYTVRRGDNLTEISRRYGVSIGEVKDWNNLRSGKILVGQKLKIMSGNPANVNAAVASAKNAPQLKPKYHTVQRGDTLWTISQRYGLTVDKLKAANQMKDSRIKAGMKLLII